MSVATKNPLRIVGGQPYSGGPNTGEQQMVRGGVIRATIWSGGLAPNLSACPTGSVTSGNSVKLWSGAGRLNTIVPLVQMTSGLPAWFYDAGTITVSGVSVSGQAILGQVPPTFMGGQWSGHALVPWPTVINLDAPFTSGLCVSCASGAPGFTVTFTPEVVYPGAVVG